MVLFAGDAVRDGVGDVPGFGTVAGVLVAAQLSLAVKFS